MALAVGLVGVNSFVAVPGAAALAPAAIDTTATAGVLTGISCPTPSFCVAVDLDGNAVVEQASTWTVTNIDPDAPLYAVSCASASFCVAVDGLGNALTDKKGTWTTALVDPGNVLDAVSCPTASFCVATDTAGNAVTDKKAKWSTAAIDPGNSLDAVSCVSAKICAAVDSKGNLLLLHSSKWTATAIDPATALYGISCSGSTFCAAVDRSGRGLTPTGTGSSRWTDPQSKPVSSAQVDAVYCVSSNFCVAVDNGGGASIFSGSSWSGSSVDSSNELDAVSCASSTSCTAVDDAGNALTYNGSGWSEAAVDRVLLGVSCVGTGGTSSFCAASGENGSLYSTSDQWATVSVSPIGNGSSLNGVSCLSSAFCALVAKSGTATIWTGSGGGQQTAVDNKPLNAVSCVTIEAAPLCWAVDNHGNAVSYNGTSWSVLDDIDGKTGLKAVSCVTPDGVTPYCTASDGDGNVFTNNGAGWSAAISIDSPFNLVSVSCSSSTVCVANDNAGDVFITSNDWSSFTTKKVLNQMGQMSCFDTMTCQSLNQNIRVDWTTNQWASHSTKQVSNHSLKSISCWGATNCSAVDSGGESVTTDNDWTATTVVKLIP